MRLEYFQLIDRVVALDLDSRTIEVEANVPVSSTIFDGHFPGLPLMPGVLLLEAMAQTSGWLTIGITKFTRMPFLAAFKEAKLRSFVKPGTRLAVHATVEHEGSGFFVTRAQIKVEGRLVSNAELTLRTIPFPSPDLCASMEKLAAAIAFPMQARAQGTDP
jgi:3-hydroxyacyl-[acyl-carrier-protein] dehydratase